MIGNFTLSWENITVQFDGKKKKKALDNISGAAQNKKIIGIMGSSGSGKTTLLGAISGRLKKKVGSVRINGEIVSKDYIKNISGYVLHDHIFTASLTAEEHLKFLCGLQLHEKTSTERNQIVSELLTEVNLDGKTLIKDLSGGEKRKLALASELINDPVILFCDEPTTGLDSYWAISIVEKLKKVASEGKIVLTTIHQPSSQIFDMFDEILLIARGKLIFQGNQCEIAQFFATCHLRCPENFNPADFYMNCLIKDEQKLIDGGIREKASIEIPNKFVPNKPGRKKRSSFLCNLRWLLWRSFIDIKRNRNVHMMSIGVLMTLATILSLSYSSVSINDVNSIQNIQGLLFSMATELIYPNMYSVITVFPEEITVFLKEKHLYSPYPYFLSKFLSLIPICLVGSVIYSIIFFVVLQVFHGFFLWIQMTYLLFLISMVSCCFGLAFSAILRSVKYVDLIFGNTEFFLVLFSGFWIKLGSLSSFLVWVKYISPFFYAFETLTILFWTDTKINNDCSGNNSTSCFRNGDQVLKVYGIPVDYNIIIYDVIYVHGLIVVFCLLGFAGILRKRMIYSVY